MNKSPTLKASPAMSMTASLLTQLRAYYDITKPKVVA